MARQLAELKAAAPEEDMLRLLHLTLQQEKPQLSLALLRHARDAGAASEHFSLEVPNPNPPPSPPTPTPTFYILRPRLAPPACPRNSTELA